MKKLHQTPSATVGPYFSMKLKEIRDLAGPGVAGEPVWIEGRVFDGDKKHVEDALIEIWQADAAGRYRHPDDAWNEAAANPEFSGYGRAHTEFQSGLYAFSTIKPGPVPAPGGGLQAPHLNVIVTARGMLNHLYTRLYFGDETAANAADPVLKSVPDERRVTLIAEPVESEAATLYRFDVRLQGEAETVFFDV